MKIVTVEEMRRIEQATDAGGHSYAAMMDMAGRAVAEAAINLILNGPEESALVLVGPGNNGGDGVVAARYLIEAGTQVAIYVWRRDVKGDKNFQHLKRSGRRRGLTILWADNDPEYAHLREQLQVADLLVDALLGTGVSRPIDGKLAEILAVVNEEISQRRAAPSMDDSLGQPLQFPLGEAYSLGLRLPGSSRSAEDAGEPDWDFPFDEGEESVDEAEGNGEGEEDIDLLDDLNGIEDEDWDEDNPFRPPWPPLPVVAVDCPSGLNSDTGEVDPLTIPAQLTVTLAYPKWGQLEHPGAAACGVLGVADIGVPPELADDVQTELAGPADVRDLLPERPADANKGTFGKAMIVAGSLNYTGAAYLSGAAAPRAGAGLVTLAIPARLHTALAAALPETTWLLLPDQDGTHSAAGVEPLLNGLTGYHALLVGPGLSTHPGARAFVETLFSPDGLFKEDWGARLVADADCLNILATLPDWPALLPPGTILTPHPGEMSRLTKLTIPEINSRRIETARKYAAEWGHVVLLKGAHTVIAAPDGRTSLLPFETPALATAGSGDVLAGAIVGMLAQGLAPYEAALCGAYIHGHAGLILQREVGTVGGVAGDILARLPQALHQLWQG